MSLASLQALVRARAPRFSRVEQGRSRRAYFHARGSTLRVHRVFVNAPREVQDAIARWVAGDRSGRRVFSHYYTRAISAEQLAARKTGASARSLVGSDRYLLQLQREIGRRYFKHWKPIAIRWMPSEGTSARKIKLGHYEPWNHAIAINPVFRRARAPRAALARTVYHEMLHHDMPTTISSAERREVHTPEFRRRERRFAGYAESERWRHGDLVRIMSERARRRAAVTRRS